MPETRKHKLFCQYCGRFIDTAPPEPKPAHKVLSLTEEERMAAAALEVEKVADALRSVGENRELAIYKTAARHFAEIYLRDKHIAPPETNSESSQGSVMPRTNEIRAPQPTPTHFEQARWFLRDYSGEIDLLPVATQMIAHLYATQDAFLALQSENASLRKGQDDLLAIKKGLREQLSDVQATVADKDRALLHAAENFEALAEGFPEGTTTGVAFVGSMLQCAKSSRGAITPLPVAPEQLEPKEASNA